MNSNNMIAVAIITSALAIIVVTLKRWLEQRRIERMRQAVLHMDAIGRAETAGETLRPWISTDALRLLALMIQHHGQHMGMLRLPTNPNRDRAISLAEEWQHSTPPSTVQPVPSNPAQAKALRATLMDFLQLIKEAHHEHLIGTVAAKDRIREAKILNAQVCVATYQNRARAAIKQENPNQALIYFKRAEATISDLKDLTPELSEELTTLQEAIKQLEVAKQEQLESSRLAGEAEELSEAENSWKKKNFD